MEQEDLASTQMSGLKRYLKQEEDYPPKKRVRLELPEGEKHREKARQSAKLILESEPDSFVKENAFVKVGTQVTQYILTFLPLHGGYVSMFTTSKHLWSLMTEFNKTITGYVVLHPGCEPYFATQRKSWTSCDGGSARFARFGGCGPFEWEVMAPLQRSKLTLYLKDDYLDALCENERKALASWTSIELDSGHFLSCLDIRKCTRLVLRGYGQGFENVQNWHIHPDLSIEAVWQLTRCYHWITWSERIARRCATLEMDWPIGDALCERYIAKAFNIIGLEPQTIIIRCQFNGIYSKKNSKVMINFPVVKEVTFRSINSSVPWSRLRFERLSPSLEVVKFENATVEAPDLVPFAVFAKMSKLRMIIWSFATIYDERHDETVKSLVDKVRSLPDFKDAYIEENERTVTIRRDVEVE